MRADERVDLGIALDTAARLDLLGAERLRAPSAA